MTKLARIAFGVLVLATVGAFFVTQKLKSSPPVIERPRFAPASRLISTSPSAPTHGIAFSFWIIHSDDVDVSIVNADGRIVRQLANGTFLPHRVRRTYHWNGRNTHGKPVPDGRYSIRVALIHQGRTIDLGPQIVIDSTPPRPLVTAVTPEGATGPAFLPQHGVHDVTIHVSGTQGRQARVVIYRTDVRPARAVTQIVVPGHQHSATWNGLVDGRPVPAGTYLAAVKVADRAGNLGTFPAQLPPRPGAGRLPGRAGITVRYLAAAPPDAPVQPGRVATIFVDARGRRYQWALRQLGDRAVLAHGHARAGSARLRVRIPSSAPTGLFGLTLVAAGHRTQVPVVVRADAAHPHSVLVVLPVMTWQGLNPVDDDGDGLPNTLPNGGPVALVRPYANGMPASIAPQEGALLQLLDTDVDRYDLTTDAALASGTGATLSGHRGVILAGDERWITPQLAAQLRRYVQGGGRVWTLGTDSLRRTVTMNGDELSDPSRAPSATDALDARPRQPLVESQTPTTMTVFQDGPLFANTSGQFGGWSSYETLGPFPAAARQMAAAGPPGEAGSSTPVIAQWSLGDGWAVHTGLPQFAAIALGGDLDAQSLARQLWTLLSAPSSGG